MVAIFKPSRLVEEALWPFIGKSIFNFQTPKTINYWAAELLAHGKKRFSEEDIAKMKAMKVKDLSYSYIVDEDGVRLLEISAQNHSMTFSNATRQSGQNEEMRGEKLQNTLQSADKEKSIYEVLLDAVEAKSAQDTFESSLGGQWLSYLFGNPAPELAETDVGLSKVHPCFKPMFLQAIETVLKDYPWEAFFNDQTEEDLERQYEARGRALAKAFDKAFLNARFSLPIEILDLIDAEEKALETLKQHQQSLKEFDSGSESNTWYVRRKNNLIGAGGAVGVIALVVTATVFFAIPIVGPIIAGVIAFLVGVGAVVDFREREKAYGDRCNLRIGMASKVSKGQKVLKQQQAALDKAMIVEPVVAQREVNPEVVELPKHPERTLSHGDVGNGVTYLK